MQTKTCGECKYYSSEAKKCDLRKIICNIQVSDKACYCFEQKLIPNITNGDKIRQMPDEELAKKLVYQRTDGWWVATIVYNGAKFTHKETAIAATVEELKKEWKA